MSDLELCKLRTASPASGTVELIRRCHWAHDRLTLAEDLAGAISAHGEDHGLPPHVSAALVAYRRAGQ